MLVGDTRGQRANTLLAAGALLALLLTACGGTGGQQAGRGEASPEDAGAAAVETPSAAAEGDLQEVQVLLPAESPIEYPHRVAEEVGYYAEEGLATSYQYSGGSSEVIQQLIAGNGDIGVTCAGAIIEALSEGFTELRPVFNTVYGSIFGISVPEDSDINAADDLAGKTIGISDPAGGEVPIVRGILREAGLSEDDVNLLPIGEATAVGLRAIEQGQVDALGGSLSDFFGLEVQGLELRPIGGEQIADLPACGVVVTEEYLADNADVVEGFLRATAKGQQFGQESEEATLAILEQVSPEGYGGEEGRLFLEAYLPYMQPPDGEPYGGLTAESYERYFDFASIEAPDVDLAEIVVTDFVEPANDYDPESVASDAAEYSS